LSARPAAHHPSLSRLRLPGPDCQPEISRLLQLILSSQDTSSAALLLNAGQFENLADHFCGLCAGSQPSLSCLFIHAVSAGLLVGVVGTDFLDKSSVSRRSGVSHNDSIVGCLFLSHSS